MRKWYDSEFAEVSYHKACNVAFVVWKKFCRGEDYRAPLQCALEIMRTQKNCHYAADTRTGFENEPADTVWVTEDFIPAAYAAGCRYIFFIIDKENSLKEELEGQEAGAQSAMQFQYVYSLEEIGDFLRAQKKE